MTPRMTFTSLIVVISLFAASCGGSAINSNADAATTTATATDRTRTQTLTPSPVVLNTLNSDSKLDKGLEKLKSYRTYMTYSLEGKDEQGQPQKMSIVMAQETVLTSMDLHVKLSTFSTVTSTVSGSAELYAVGNTTYVYNPYVQANRRCTRVPSRVSLKLNPATLFKPSEVLGLLDNATLVKTGESIAGALVDQYSGGVKDYSTGPYATASGDLWVAREGGYIVKYVGMATGKTALLGGDTEGNIKWDYAIQDIDAIDAIQLPPECPAVRPVTTAVSTPVSTSTPAVVDEIPLTDDATEQTKENGISTFRTKSDLNGSTAYYRKLLARQGWVENLQSADPSFIQSAYCSTPVYQDGKASLVIPQAMYIYSKGMRTVTIFITNADGGSRVMLMDSGAL